MQVISILFMYQGEKIPCIEQTFLLDQRKERKMFIGGADAKTSNILRKREDRKRKAARASATSSTQRSPESLLSSDECSSDTTTSEEEFHLPSSTKTRISKEIKSKEKASEEQFMSSIKKTVSTNIC